MENDQSQNDTNNTNITPELPTNNVENRLKSRKIPYIIAVFALIVAAGFGWMLLKDTDDKQQSTSTQQSDSGQKQDAETSLSNIRPKYIFQQGAKLQYIDENMKIRDIVELSDNETFIEAFSQENDLVIRYATTKTDAQGGLALQAYGEVSAEGKKELFQFPDGISQFWTNPTLSPDRKHMVIEKSDSNGLMSEIIQIDAQDGKPKTIYTPTEADFATGLLAFVGWRDDNTLLYQRQSCRHCDGPYKPALVSIDTTTGKLTELLDASNYGKGASFGQFFLNPSKSSHIFLQGTDFGRFWEHKDQYTPDYLFEVNTKDGSVREIISRDEAVVTVAGFSDDGSTAYYAVADVVPAVEGEEGAFEYFENQQKDDPAPEREFRKRLAPEIIAVSTVNGSEQKINYESDYIDGLSYINSIVESGDNLLIFTTGQNGDNQSGYALLSIPKAGGKATLLTSFEPDTKSLSPKFFPVGR